MNLPRYANPHFLAQTTQITSRAELNAVEDDTEMEEYEELKAKLHAALLKRGLDLREDTESKPMKKRRKLEEHGSSVVDFRLVSSTPRKLDIAPKPPKVIHVKEPECEDTEEQHSIRVQQSASVAVDFDWIMREAIKPTPHVFKDGLLEYYAKSPSPSSTLMIAETQKPKQPRIIHLGQQIRPSPHEFPSGELCCPTLPVQPIVTLKKKRKRCYKHKINPQPPVRPQFWRPETTWNGYAYGYPMSRPISQGGLKSGHCRDTMRKGVVDTIFVG